MTSNDHTIRLSLIRTPGTHGGYHDQATQDIGHHEFVYGLAGHASGWRDAQTDWQAQRLNDPLIAFQTSKHAGFLGREFSLLKISNPRIRVFALKKAEQSDEFIVRLVELDGKPQSNLHVAFASAIAAAREVNGQEQPVGQATVNGGTLVTSFSAYQVRTFAVKLAPPANKIRGVRSVPVKLDYDLAAASTNGTHTVEGFDGKGNALPSEMVPSEIKFGEVDFQLAPARSDVPNAVVAKGQQISLPQGHFDRLYILAASSDGDQKATFQVGDQATELNIQDCYIKRAELAWYSDHNHDSRGENLPYSYSYLFAYKISLPPGARSLKLPNNDRIRVLAGSAVEENPLVIPAQPLYDVLPPPKKGEADRKATVGSPMLWSFLLGL